MRARIRKHISPASASHCRAVRMEPTDDSTTLLDRRRRRRRRRDDAAPADLERRYGAANYHPLPVTLQRGAGVWLFDTAGRRYLDMMSAYSAVSFGHGHPALVRVLDRAGRAPGGDEPRLPHRPPRPVPARRLRDDRHGQGAADEHRRRGGRDGGQGGAQVGLQGQAHRRRARRDHRRRRQLRRPDDDDHRLLERSRSTATASARSRPASSACRSATPPRSRRRSRRTRRRSWSSRSRARPASSFRPPATWRGRARSAPGAASS